MTDRELLARMRALTAGLRIAPDFRQVATLLDVMVVQVTASTIREMARLNPFGAGARRVVAVTSDVVFGMARMYQILSDEPPGELQIFRSSGKWMTFFGGFGLPARKAS